VEGEAGEDEEIRGSAGGGSKDPDTTKGLKKVGGGPGGEEYWAKHTKGEGGDLRGRRQKGGGTEKSWGGGGEKVKMGNGAPGIRGVSSERRAGGARKGMGT